MKYNLVVVIVLVLFFQSTLGIYESGKRVLLENVQVLTLHSGEWTTGRRSSAVPQLKCVGGSARQYANRIDAVQCTNSGSDGYDVQWKCETQMDSTVKFGKISVSCEGYDYPDDPYILAGSCGLEYTLEYTSGSHSNSYSHGYNSYDTGSTSGFGRIILLGIIAFIAYNVYQQCVRVRGPGMPAPPPATGGQYWGPGGPGRPNGGPGYGGYNDNCQPPPSNHYGSSNWQPGFWSGLATGGALGHLFTRGRTPGYGYGTGGSMFGTRSYGLGGGSSMGSLRTASGFGGTRRR